VDERFVELFRRQQASGFEDVRGAEASVTLPVSERLLNEAIAESLPASAPVRELHVKPQAGDRFAVSARIGSSSWLPAINLGVVIDRQPDLPSSPVLVLRLETSGLSALAGAALRFLNSLPPGIRVEADRIFVDVAKLLDARGLRRYLAYVNELRVNTVDGAVVIFIRGRL
jgi:hypothetical protein